METPAATNVRIDKWLWAIRLFKTRTLATTACTAGHVKINGQSVKPARPVQVGEIISAQNGDIIRTVKVIAPLDKRVGAKLVKDYAEELTPPSEFEKKREPYFQPLLLRPKGSGRPTKKDRRAIEGLF